MPPQYETDFHFHDEQQELYFLHSGAIEIEFGDGTVHRLEPGGFARVDPEVHRKVRNVGDTEAVIPLRGRQGRLRGP